MSDFDKNKVTIFINKWMPLLERIYSDESLKERCKAYNAYVSSEESFELTKELRFSEFLDEAYESGIVINDYQIFTDGKEESVANPIDDFLSSLSLIDVMRCIAYHFRRDHFNEGSLINESFVNGALLRLFNCLISKMV